MTMNTESTTAKIGRSMKKRENMGLLRLWLGGWLRFRLGLRLGFGNLDRRPGPELHEAVGDDALAALQALDDDPGIARPLARPHRPRLSQILVVDQINEFSLWTLENGALRHEERLRPHGAVQDDAHELPRAERALGVG